ncbi:MAG: aminotransferase class I/II-fold pyridoxal phosphate-dependent enzyme [Firmicutes bacterium]|nr:aminotransferase class I/II-fold pyridoxal phosphate-dependent enzyme [Bacillota bacterium]
MIKYMNANVTGIKASEILEFSGLAANTPGCIGLTIGEPDFTTPESIKQKAAEALAGNKTHYADGNGLPELRAAISEFEKKKNGLNYSPEEIIVTAGATEAIYSAMTAILEPGDEVILPLPDFSFYDQVVEIMGAKCVYIDTSKTGFQLAKEDLAAAVTEKTKAIVINTPNNPTGVVYTKETLQGIHDVLAGKPIFIFCDEVYNQLVYTDEYASLASYKDLKQQLIVVQSYSKPYAMTGWRVGYIMADAPVVNVIAVVHQNVLVSLPEFIQPACIEALNYDPSEMRETYRKRRDYICGRLAEIGLEIAMPEGAFYVFPYIGNFGMNSLDFCTKMVNETALAVLPGRFFGNDNYIRISYCYSDEQLREGMDRLEKFVKSLA